jgi:hypothetical protein
VRVLAQRGPDDLPYLRQLTAEAGATSAEPFIERITTVLVGIAIERGEPWQPIADQIRSLP